MRGVERGEEGSGLGLGRRVVIIRVDEGNMARFHIWRRISGGWKGKWWNVEAAVEAEVMGWGVGFGRGLEENR